MNMLICSFLLYGNITTVVCLQGLSLLPIMLSFYDLIYSCYQKFSLVVFQIRLKYDFHFCSFFCYFGFLHFQVKWIKSLKIYLLHIWYNAYNLWFNVITHSSNYYSELCCTSSSPADSVHFLILKNQI